MDTTSHTQWTVADIHSHVCGCQVELEIFRTTMIYTAMTPALPLEEPLVMIHLSAF